VLWAAGALLAAGTVTAAGGTNGRSEGIEGNQGTVWMGMPGVWDGQSSVVGEVLPVRVAEAAQEPVNAPQAEPEPAPVPAPAEAVEPAVTVDGSAEQIICAVWGDLCAKALRVAACESGPDYYAGWSAHVGTFQIYPGHAARFQQHGWDYYVDGDDIYANSVIAYEIFLESGWGPWPYCQYA